jgi:hypothetical protein
VTLSWSALPEEGYSVCWDTTNNNACDTTWWPNAAATTRALTALPVGTYYWPFDLVDQRALRATLRDRRGPTASRMGGR